MTCEYPSIPVAGRGTKNRHYSGPILTVGTTRSIFNDGHSTFRQIIIPFNTNEDTASFKQESLPRTSISTHMPWKRVMTPWIRSSIAASIFCPYKACTQYCTFSSLPKNVQLHGVRVLSSWILFNTINTNTMLFQRETERGREFWQKPSLLSG